MTLMHVTDTLEQVTTTRPPATPQWAPTYGPPARPATGGRLAIVLVGLIAIAALVVGIVSLAQSPTSAPVSNPAMSSPAPAPPPAFTSDETTAAKNSLCSAWSVASSAVKAETNRDDPALARMALTNSAAIVEAAAQNPALPSNDRHAALSVSDAYRMMTAVSSTAAPGTPEFQAALDGANQAARQMQAVCP